jgi:SAM-dependent methyltransferase
MSEPDRRSHWQNVYLSKGEQDVSWSQKDPQPSLGLIEKFASGLQAPIIDIGGGASRLVDALRRRGFAAVTVLDVSQAALEVAKHRLGREAANVQWIAADATIWQPPQPLEIWHDRAAFHFLVEERDRKAYIDRLCGGVKAGGHAIIGTFALDGPEKCSGLQVTRYDAKSLAEALGPAFELADHFAESHRTPWGAIQHFQFSRFRLV